MANGRGRTSRSPVAGNDPLAELCDVGTRSSRGAVRRAGVNVGPPGSRPSTSDGIRVSTGRPASEHDGLDTAIRHRAYELVHVDVLSTGIPTPGWSSGEECMARYATRLDHENTPSILTERFRSRAPGGYL